MRVTTRIIAMAAPLLLAAGPSQPGYRLVRRVLLGGEGRWDYLTFDAPRHRLFISHGTEVLVVGGDTGNILGVIPNTDGVHGVALAQDLGRGFTSNGKANTVTEFDLASLKPVRQIAIAAQNPDAILYDSASHRVFTFNGRSYNATVIDAAAGRVMGMLPLGGKPEFGVADGRGRVYVNLEDRSALLSFDAASAPPRVLENVATEPGARTMAVDPASHRVYLVTAKFGPRPESTAVLPKPRPPTIPGTFVLLMYDR